MENFTGKDDSPTIKEFIQKLKNIFGEGWKFIVPIITKQISKEKGKVRKICSWLLSCSFHA